MALMATLADRILDAIRYAPLDDVLAKRLGVGHRQAVNQAARRLQAGVRAGICMMLVPALMRLVRANTQAIGLTASVP